MDPLSPYKIAGVVAYLLVLLLIGAVASRRMGDVQDYYAGGKRFSFWAGAFSARATGESAWLLLGLTGMGALIGFVVVLAYIVSGGFVAVVWSDVFQGALMFIGLVTLPVVGALYAGGPSAVAAGLSALDPALLTLSGAGGWSLVNVLQAIGFVTIGVGFLGSPQIFVLLLALRSEREVRPGAAVAFTWTLFADTGAVLTGMVGRYLLTVKGADPELTLGSGAQDVLPQLAELVLPAALVGLLIAVVLSAVMSTVDSLLVLASSAAVRDWYQQVRHPGTPDAALVPLSRAVTAGLALAALGVALTVAAVSPTRTVFWFVVFGWSGIAATFCPTMILSLAWSGVTTRGALASMVTGFVCVPVFKLLVPKIPELGPLIAQLSELPPSFVVALAVGVGVSLADSEALEGVEEELRA